MRHPTARLARVGPWLVIAGLSIGFPPDLNAQEPSADESLLNLFFDCQGRGCFDLDFFRREIPIVNWVRDREVSDVHVLVTSQRTGGGGWLFTLDFIGGRSLAGQDQSLTVSTSGDATDDDERRAIAERLKLGLVRYLASTSAAEDILVSIRGADAEADPEGAEAGEEPASGPEDDPWNYWVFQIRGNGFMFGESSFSESNYSANVSANRTTADWKFNLSGRYSRRTSEFEVPDSETVTSLIEDWSTSSLLVKSLTPQWSVGARADAGRSTRLNEDFRWELAPGIEYNFVPYSESSRRSFTLQALLNVRHWDYEEVTIYGKMSETRLAPSLTAAVTQVQPWGRVNASLTGSQYLHDGSLYRISIGGFTEVRLFRGFSVNLNANYSWIRDQLFPSAGGASTEEILLRQRALETSFNYFTSFGISYRFGSIFNNVVNPRFGRSGRDHF